ncbi:hypothetical protein [Rufibacter psychrotolerans]|uniref:hypothetical protein n=1 Tax=Rufibacter psychrotolerans TaxID=2812556 RepID=UPI0019687318|nr:hypothetical protein [Rufibacter sp. SYSU D00308]
MRNTLFLLALAISLLGLPVCSFAQKNFIKGYFVTTQQDTVHCLINDRNWQKNPKEVQYKITLTGEATTFKPSQVQSFGLATGELYEGRVVTFTASPMDLENLQTTVAPNTVTDTVFLRVLARGSANLLYLYNGQRDHFFYQANSGAAVELTVHRHLQDNALTGKALLVQENHYQNQLATLFKDCPAVAEKLSAVKYTISDLRAVFRQYNACRKTEAYTSARDKVRVRFGVMGGVAQHRLELRSSERPELEKTRFESPLAPTYGISLTAVLPRNRQRWSIYNELALKPYKATGTYHQHINFAYEHRLYETEFSVNSLGLVNMVRYQVWAGGAAKPFVGVGMANNFILQFKEHQRVHVTYDFSERQEFHERLPVGHNKKHELAAVVAAGVTFKKATVEVRGELGNGFADSSPASSSRKAVSFLVGYQFNQ